MNIYVGNLPYRITEDEIREAFEAHGEVSRVTIIKDRETDRSKGFGFVDMPNGNEGNAAIKAINETELNGRNVRVNEAKPREDRPRTPRY